MFLVATDAGDGSAGDFVLWQEPRLVVPGRPTLLLRDAREFIRNATARRERIFSATAKCLSVAASAAPASEGLDTAKLAEQSGVDEESLQAWLEDPGFNSNTLARVDYFTNQLRTAGGYQFVQGWGSAETPNLVANASDQWSAFQAA